MDAASGYGSRGLFPGTLPTFGPHCQRSEVGTGGYTDNDLCRHFVPFRSGFGPGPPRQVAVTGSSDTTDFRQRGCISPNLGKPDWENGLFSRRYFVRSTASSSHTKAGGQELGASIRELGGLHPSGVLGQPSFAMVDGQGQHFNRSSSDPLFSSSDNVHRRQSGGLGGDFRFSDGAGCMEECRESVTFQRERDVGSHYGNTTLQRSVEEFRPANLFRQFHHHRHNQQTGGNKELVYDRSGLEILGVGGSAQLQGTGPAHPGCSERFRGSFKPARTGDCNGVDTEFGCSGVHLGRLGNSPGGSVCHSDEPPSSCVRVPSSRSSGVTSQRSHIPMDRSTAICISPVGNLARSTVENLGGSGRCDSDCSVLARESVVPSSAGSAVGTSNSTSQERRPIVSAPFRGGLSELTDAGSSCMEAIREAMKIRGFSEKVMNRVCHNVRPSSSKIYDGKWQTFVRWCSQNKVQEPTSISRSELADFFVYLFEEKKLEVRTISGYRSAINRVLRLYGHSDIAQDVFINSLFSNFYLERPISRGSEYPKWDLTVVLDLLTKAPFEPLKEASFNDLTKKTVFLLLLASGSRRNEIHALDVDRITFFNDDQYVTLKPRIGFIAKNHNVKTGKGKFDGFTIHSIKDFMESDRPSDASLCPVRCLRHYLRAAAQRRGNVKTLFVTCSSKGPTKAAHLNTITGWIKDIINRAFSSCKDKSKFQLDRPVHEIRAVGPSYAFYQNTSLENILEQCRWAHPNTFTDFYLRDLAGKENDLFSLPPVMTAGSMVTSLDGGSRKGVARH